MFTLQGKTLKGKNRVREHGKLWQEIARRDQVLFTSQSGPWLLLESTQTQDSRWIHATDDKDFLLSNAGE